MKPFNRKTLTFNYLNSTFIRRAQGRANNNTSNEAVSTRVSKIPQLLAAFFVGKEGKK